MLSTELATISYDSLPASDPELQSFIDRKSPWSSTAETATSLKREGCYGELLRKCVALGLSLEIPVGEFTLSASRTDLPAGTVRPLLSNSKDELVHYEAFKKVSQDIELPNSFIKRSEAFAAMAEKMPYHPVLVAGYLELGVFLTTLSIMRLHGCFTLKMLTKDISRDESTHVLTNWGIIDRYLPEKGNLKQLETLRRGIIQWLVMDLPPEDQKRWKKQSEDLINKRSAAAPKSLQAGMYVPFLEVAATDLGYYA